MKRFKGLPEGINKSSEGTFKNGFKRMRYVCMSLILIMSMLIMPVSADEKSDLEARNAELEEQIASERERISELEDSIASISEYIDTLQEELNSIAAIISDYEQQKAEKQAEVDELNAAIADLEATISDLDKQIEEKEEDISYQYSLMSLRIQYLYENVGNSYFEAIFTAGTFSDAIAKIQYLLELSDYDREIMDSIRDLVEDVKKDQDDVAEKKKEVEEQAALVEEQMQEIQALEDAQKEQEAFYEEIKATQEEQLANDQREMDEAQAIIDSFNSEIEENQSAINSLIANYDNSGSSGGSGSYSSSGFIWPLSGYSFITSYFGYRADVDWDVMQISGASSYHQGIDIYAPSGTPIMAVADGVVLSNYWSNAIGWTVIFYHGDGLFTEYHHMCQQAPVSVGSYVSQGQVVGYVGATGIYSTGSHLHFGVSKGNSDAYSVAAFVDPLAYY